MASRCTPTTCRKGMHAWVTPPPTGRAVPWEYRGADGGTRSLEVASRVVVNNAESYIAACLAGLGLIQIPRFDVQHLLERGRWSRSCPIGVQRPCRCHCSIRTAASARGVFRSSWHGSRR